MKISRANREAFRVIVRDAQRQMQLTKTINSRGYMLHLIVKYKRILKESAVSQPESEIEMYWTQENGKQIAISEMSTGHIKNTLAMLEKKGYIATETLVFYLTCRQPTSEGALDCFNRELDVVVNSKHTRYIAIFEAELQSRAI